MTQNKRKAKKKSRNKGAIPTVVASVIIALATCYVIVAFSPLTPCKYLRELWIETAMTTARHQYLAYVFPKSVVKDVMSRQVQNDISGGTQYLKLVDNETQETAEPPDVTETEEVTEPEETEQTVVDILGQLQLSVGDLDYAENEILVNDIEQGIIISRIDGGSYKGLAMLIDDPSRVYLSKTDYVGTKGMRILQYLERDDAIAGINASGFMDYEGVGNGGEVVGLSISQGEIWGEYVDYYGSVVLTTDNKLVVGDISAWENYNIRDGIQFGPVLVADGEKHIEGSGGWGIHPRTAIGQREDGVIVMIVIDGRDATWSLGCEVGELADIIMKYNVENAACCDGGASCVLAYDGQLLNKNCSANPSYGRLMPNAFLVRKKQ